jgi:hypothetical protein
VTHGVHAPQEVVRARSSSLGALNATHAGAERVEAAHHVLDRAVLAGGVAALQHDQEAALAAGEQALLQVEHAGQQAGHRGLGVGARRRRRRRPGSKRESLARSALSMR